MINCKYLKDKKCELASKLATTDVYPDIKVCIYCSQSDTPQQINNAVVSLAINAANKKDPKIAKNLISKYQKILTVQAASSNNDKKLKEILNGNGVGSQLWKLLEGIGIEHKATCNCIHWAEKMNKWGKNGCNENRKLIIENMKNNAKSYGWGDISKAVTKSITSGLAFKLSIVDPYGSLLNEAIRLSEQKRIKK